MCPWALWPSSCSSLPRPSAPIFPLDPGGRRIWRPRLLRWCAVFDLIIWPLAFTLPNALRAAGDAVFTMAVSLASMFLFRIGFSYLLSCSWGLDLGLLGVWIAMIIDWWVRALIFIFRFVQGKWKRIRLI